MKSKDLIDTIKAFLQDKKVWEYHGKAFLKIIEKIKEYDKLQQQNSELKKIAKARMHELVNCENVCIRLNSDYRTVTRRLVQLKEVTKETITTLEHARTFIGSRGKMHSTGIELYEKQINTLKAMIKEE